MSAAISALTTLSLTEQAAALYIQRVENLRSIGEFFLLSMVVGLAFSGFLTVIRFIVFIVKKIYNYFKERSFNCD